MTRGYGADMVAGRPIAKIAPALALFGSVLVVVGASLPWIQTGRVRRSAFTVVRVANEIGVFERSSERVAVLTLLAAPAVASLGLFLTSVGLRRIGSICYLGVGALGLAIGLFGLRFSSAGLPGPMVTAIGGGLAVIGSLASLLVTRSPRPNFEQRQQRGFSQTN